MEITEHGLKKPAATDFYNVDDFNENTDIIERHFNDKNSHVNAEEIADIKEINELSPIGSEDTNNTIWAKIKKAISMLLSHVSTVSTSSVLGHIKIGTGLTMSSGTASVKLTDSVSTDDSTTALSAKGAKALNDAKAPNSHASTATTYGIGNATNYGHVKLSDTYASNVGAAAVGVGASQKALYEAYNNLNTNLANIGQVKEVYPTGTISFGTDVYVDICGFNLSAGTYLILGQIGTFTPTDINGICFTNWNNSIIYKENCTSNNIMMYMELTETTNIKLRVKLKFDYQTRGLTPVRDYLQAIRVK